MELRVRSKLFFVVAILLNNASVEMSTVVSTLKPNISSPKNRSNTSKPFDGADNTEYMTTEYYFLSSKEPFEICEFNSTCNFTDFPNATDSELLTTNFPEKTPVISNSPTTQQYCTCDLQVS